MAILKRFIVYYDDLKKKKKVNFLKQFTPAKKEFIIYT